MRNKLTFLTVLLFASLVLSACAGAVQAADETSTRTINVNGSSKVVLTPDIAYIYIGVQSEDEDAEQAVADNNERTQGVIDALLADGIAEEDIQTTNFSVYPRLDYGPNGELRGITFVVNNSVYVTLRDIDQIGGVLNEAVSAGANSISGISFDVEDKNEALSEAREQAIEDARGQAEELAQAAGVTLGDIQTINSYSSFPPAPIYERDFAMEAAVAAGVPISPGQMTITMEVNVVFEIR